MRRILNKKIKSLLLFRKWNWLCIKNIVWFVEREREEQWVKPYGVCIALISELVLKNNYKDRNKWEDNIAENNFLQTYILFFS